MGVSRLSSADGEHGDYLQWLVEEKVEASFPFRTYFAIPVYTRLYGREEQSIVGQPHRIEPARRE